MRGFSTAEVVLSAFVLALGIMTLTTLFPASTMAVKRGENRLTADALGQSALEAVRAASFPALAFYDTDLGNMTRSGTTFTRHQQVFRVYGTDPNHLKGVRVTIGWTERNSLQTWTQETWICSIEK